MPVPRWKDLVGAGSWTDLAVALVSGGEVDDHGDHLVLRTPANPNFYWGNCLRVLNTDMADDAERWVARHREALPGLGHVAIGLPCEVDPAPYAQLGLDIEHEQTLGTSGRPAQRPLPAGYQLRALDGDADWDGFVRLFTSENDRTGDHPADHFDAFNWARATQRRVLTQQGAGRFFGVFHGSHLVAHCGMVRCGDVGRYQSALVDADHRRRGLAGHLVGHVGAWGRDQGLQQLVIVADQGSAAEGLYRGLGFTGVQTLVAAFRGPPR